MLLLFAMDICTIITKLLLLLYADDNGMPRTSRSCRAVLDARPLPMPHAPAAPMLLLSRLRVNAARTGWMCIRLFLAIIFLKFLLLLLL